MVNGFDSNFVWILDFFHSEFGCSHLTFLPAFHEEFAIFLHNFEVGIVIYKYRHIFVVEMASMLLKSETIGFGIDQNIKSILKQKH